MSDTSALNDASGMTHVLWHDDLGGWKEGATPNGFRIVTRGLGKYLESPAPQYDCGPYMYTFGDGAWFNYRIRAVITPVSFENAGATGGYCGIVARYRDSSDYVALVLARDGLLKLLRRTVAGFEVMAQAPLEFCIGQSLTLTLSVRDSEIVGTAGPYAGATTIKAQYTAGASGSGRAGCINAAYARFGPQYVECTPAEAGRVVSAKASRESLLEQKRAKYPRMKVERRVRLDPQANGGDVRLADINNDGKLEILVGQSSHAVAQTNSLTRLTCLTVLDLEGKSIWQAGLPDLERNETLGIWPPRVIGKLPFEVHDLYGDGHPLVVCVFGYDLQLRDGKTGRVLLSATTPSTVPVSTEFKTIAPYHTKWGDETLNMNVAWIGFCDTQGNGGKREIIVRDEYHNLAVLDPMAEPVLHPIITHRGLLSGGAWIGDIDADGKDEIIAGYSLLDHDGTLLNSLAPGGEPSQLLVLQDNDSPSSPRRVLIGAEYSGLFAFDLDLIRTWNGRGARGRTARVSNHSPSVIRAAKFLRELPGVQIAVLEDASTLPRVVLYDGELNRLWTREVDELDPESFHTIKWTGNGEELLMAGIKPGMGLMDGSGDIVVEIPAETFASNCSVVKGYCPDGRDAIAAWNSDELVIYVPEK